MYYLREHILRTYMLEFQLKEEEYCSLNQTEIKTGSSPVVINKGMLLQVTTYKNKILVSDGENHAYLNYGRERDTCRKLQKCINNSSDLDDLQRSLFQFKNFSFKFDQEHMGYNGESLVVSLECEEYHCIAPNNYLEKNKKDQYIDSVLSQTQKDNYIKRAKNSLLEKNSNFINNS